MYFSCTIFYVGFPRTAPGTDDGSAVLKSRVVSRTKYEKLISKITIFRSKNVKILHPNRAYQFCTVSTALQYN